MVEFSISTFEQLAIHTKGMSNTFFKECFISGLIEEIHAQVLMPHPTTWLESSKRTWEAQKVVISQIKKTPFILYPHPTIMPP
jgi:hypothetical protein